MGDELYRRYVIKAVYKEAENGNNIRYWITPDTNHHGNHLLVEHEPELFFRQAFKTSRAAARAVRDIKEFSVINYRFVHDTQGMTSEEKDQYIARKIDEYDAAAFVVIPLEQMFNELERKNWTQMTKDEVDRVCGRLISD